ncbi:MAG: hypothetical protein NTV88_06415 [Candidatus Micrarchaeota archaeon]|nr:hypothetical protein [Candidatus Micrarchaeota archaeon]
MLDLFTIPSAVPGIGARMALAFIFTAAAAYFDIFNKKWVPNTLVYSFAALAVLINFIYYDPVLTWSALAIGAVVFAACYLLYKLGQLGGADAYVLASIAATIPYLPSSLIGSSQSAPYPFILSVLAPTGVAFILHMVLRFVPYISNQIAKGKIKFTASKIAGPIGLAAAFLVFVYALLSLPFAFPPIYMGMLIFLAVGLVFFSLFKSEIKDSMIEQMKVGKLQEEDVIALEKMDAGLVQKMKLQPVLTAQSIALLKKSKLKAVPVYTGMPFFLPYLLLGLVFTLLFGDMLLFAIR